LFDEILLENQLENLPSLAITQLADLIASNLRKEEPRQTITFKELFDLYYERRVKTKLKNQFNAYYFYRKHGARWADVQIHEINRRDVQEWVDQLGVDSKSSATKALNTLKAIINWGMQKEHIPAMLNPCKHVEAFKDVSRERFILPGEFQIFEDALLQEPQIYQDFFRICLLTGARRSNVCSMRWDEIDFELATWTLPASKFKSGRTVILPLTEEPLNLLRRRKAANQGSEWVFPSRRKTNTGGHVICVKKAWNRIMKRSGLEDLHIHDLRRTLGSYLAIQGNNAFTIAKMLGHSDLRSTNMYARLDLATVRSAAQSVSHSWLKYRRSLSTPGDTKAEHSQERHQRDAIGKGIDLAGRLSAAQQIVAEAKIIASINSGNRLKKNFYRKIGGHFPISNIEMNRILAQMESRGLIKQVRDDYGISRYDLVGENVYQSH
jgi:integrase